MFSALKRVSRGAYLLGQNISSTMNRHSYYYNVRVVRGMRNVLYLGSHNHDKNKSMVSIGDGAWKTRLFPKLDTCSHH